MKDKRIIELEGDNADAGFLTKNANADYVNRLVDVLEDKIYQISQSINSNENMQSNLSGVAILSRIINLRNKITLEQKCLRDGIRNRLKILFKYLNLAYDKNYNYRDIKINFTMNVPSDDMATAQMLSYIKDWMPADDGLNLFSFTQNGKVLYKKKLEEIKELEELTGVPTNDLGFEGDS